MTTKATTLLLLLAAAAAALLCRVHIAVAVAAADPEPCDPSDITIATVKTGRVVGGLPEFQVTIGNECSCPEGDVVLSCLDGVPAGVDRSKIHAAGGSDGLCLVNDGLQIVKGSPVVFTYAASAPISLAFDNATPRCQR
uniref:LGC1 n=1 Tax=Oryza glumipatula TaxID=40148 RepID=A0A0E0BGV8_9ORYZ